MAKTVRKAANSKPKAGPVKAQPKAKPVVARALGKATSKTTKTSAKPTPAKPTSAKTAKSAAKAKPAAKVATAKVATKTKAQQKPVARPALKPQTKSKLISAPKQLPKVAAPITTPRKVEAPKQTTNGISPSVQTSKPSAGRAMSRKAGVDLATVKLPEGYRPNDDEAFMGPHQRAYFRTKLQKWKDDIIKETMETLQVLHDDTQQHPDLADRATHETDRALELRARDRQRKLISKIESAIRRIDDGTYGYCEETGEPISLKRLDARPVATLSLEAQERHERRERVYRDE